MGVLNVTPDSFSDGGRFAASDAAIRQGLDLARQGAAIVDVGGESTRPGARRVSAATEQRRVLPVIEGLRAAAADLVISVDTMRASTARAVVQAGASIVNDVSGGLADPDMLRVVADLDCDYICQHWRASSDVMGDHAGYVDVVAEVHAELQERLRAVFAAGIATERVIIDPGLGFAKQRAHDWALIGELASFTALGHRVLVGASRKRFLAQPGDTPVDRDAATAAISLLAAKAGVWAVRVHNPMATVQAFSVLDCCRDSARVLGHPR
jgi:dihydropteroate synthase